MVNSTFCSNIPFCCSFQWKQVNWVALHFRIESSMENTELRYKTVEVNTTDFLTRSTGFSTVWSLQSGIEVVARQKESPFQGFGGPKCPLKKPYL